MFGFSTRALLAVCRYLTVNAAILLFAASLVRELAQQSIALSSAQPAAAVAMSRVEVFKKAEAEWAQRQPPVVRRMVVAYAAADTPVHVLAMQLDKAEAIKVRRELAKRRMPARTVTNVASANIPPVKSRPQLPNGLMALGGPLLLNSDVMAQGNKFAAAESARDITNRSLGVLVASKN